MTETRTQKQSDLAFSGLLCSILMLVGALIGAYMIISDFQGSLGIPMLVVGGASIARLFINRRLNHNTPLAKIAAICGVFLCGGGLAFLVY